MESETKLALRRRTVGVLSFVLGLWMIMAPRYLAGYEGPGWARMGLLLLPWILLGALVAGSHRIWRADELEILINRRALAFAFYAAFFGLLAIYHLQAAGYVSDFTWTPRDLLGGLALLMLLGIGLNRLRYR